MEKKKINVVGLVFLLLGIAVVVLSSVFGTQLYSELSVFNNNPTGNLYVDTLFHKIPSVIKSIEIITIAYLIHLLFKVILGRIFFKNKRGKTIVKLLASFLKYLIAIISIFCVLGAFGVDGVTLLASAGVLGLIIGLGAQSLIADVIAGIFIVFEADFEVGDIVVIDDWRGTVKEIGIRTTKIEDYGGNVKIVNNSQISTIVNQTKELSLARTEISIEYGMPIPEAERIIMNNLKRIKDNIPEIVEGPYYKGVNALSASSVDLLFVARCKEEDIYDVQRALNRQLKIVFDENNINIPFPQVTVSNYKENNYKTKNHDDVDSFVEAQKEASKGLEEDR